MSETTSGLSRRTIVKGAAWSVPVIAAAVATPLAAASNVPENPENVPSIGRLVESSDGLFPNKYAGSALNPECSDGTWGEAFQFTMVISYIGSDPNFSMAGATARGSWVISSASTTSVVLSYSGPVYCNSGILGADVEFHSPVDAADNAISVSAWGVNATNTKRFEALVNASGQPVVGPRPAA